MTMEVRVTILDWETVEGATGASVLVAEQLQDGTRDGLIIMAGNSVTSKLLDDENLIVGSLVDASLKTISAKDRWLAIGEMFGVFTDL